MGRARSSLEQSGVSREHVGGGRTVQNKEDLIIECGVRDREE